MVEDSSFEFSGSIVMPSRIYKYKEAISSASPALYLYDQTINENWQTLTWGIIFELHFPYMPTPKFNLDVLIEVVQN